MSIQMSSLASTVVNIDNFHRNYRQRYRFILLPKLSCLESGEGCGMRPYSPIVLIGCVKILVATDIDCHLYHILE